MGGGGEQLGGGTGQQKGQKVVFKRRGIKLKKKDPVFGGG